MKFSFMSLKEAAKAFNKPLSEVASMLEAEVSHDEVEKLIRTWLRSVRYAPDGTYLYRYLCAVYISFFIYEESTDYGDTSKVFQVGYTVAEDGTLTVGEPVEVRVEVKYVPVAASMQESKRSLRLTTIGTMREAKIDSEGMVLIKIIDAGKGSSGYYSADVLKAACEAGRIPAGTKMYADHQTESERKEKPENSILKIVAVLQEAAFWNENGPDGPGAYAKAEVKSHWREFMEAMGDDIEVSLDGFFTYSWGEVDGEVMPIVEEIMGVRSVDFVTRAGRGGKWLSLQEAARENNFQTPLDTTQAASDITPDTSSAGTSEEVNTEMTEAEIKAAQEAARKEGLKSGVALYQSAQKVAREALSALTLPAVVKESIISAQAGNIDALPMKENGVLDEEAFTTQVKDAAQNEATRAREAYNWGEGNVEIAGGDVAHASEAQKSKAATINSALSFITR